MRMKKNQAVVHIEIKNLKKNSKIQMKKKKLKAKKVRKKMKLKKVVQLYAKVNLI